MALNILMVLDVIVSVLMMISILLQSGKSAGFSGLGGGESLFGGKPTDMDEALSRFAVGLGLAFAIINVVIARIQ